MKSVKKDYAKFNAAPSVRKIPGCTAGSTAMAQCLKDQASERPIIEIVSAFFKSTTLLPDDGLQGTTFP